MKYEITNEITGQHNAYSRGAHFYWPTYTGNLD